MIRFVLCSPVTSTVILKAEFPELLIADGATKTVEQEVMFSQVFTNGSFATMKDNFNLKTTLSDTHTFVFQVKSVDFCFNKPNVTAVSFDQTKLPEPSLRRNTYHN